MQMNFFKSVGRKMQNHYNFRQVMIKIKFMYQYSDKNAPHIVIRNFL